MVVHSLIASRSQHSNVPTYPVRHPSSDNVVHSVHASTTDDVEAAISTCQAALPAWSATPLADRSKILLRAADLVEDEQNGWAEKLREANLEETSVTKWWTGQQMKDVPGFLRGLAEAAEEALKKEMVHYDISDTHVEREPFGVCLAIAAWNAVHLLTTRAFVTPLLAGNTVVLKTSEVTPHTQTLWAELLFEAGLPRECLSVIHVDPQHAATITEKLVADKRIRHVNFTGSTRVGSIIASLAGKHLKPVLMELGGKAPVILLPDADIKTAASHIIFGAFMNTGQICMSTERVFVPESRYSELASALETAWDTLKAKQPKYAFTSTSGKRIQQLVDDATEKGAVAILPSGHTMANGTMVNGNGVHATEAGVERTILGKVTENMRIWREESFGPVAILVAVPDKDREEKDVIDQMVSLANDTDYGLSAAVWSEDPQKALAVARRIESGAVHINSPTCHDLPKVPHGGWKCSGWGRFNGVEGIRSFTQLRCIEVPTNPSKPLPLHVFEL